MLFVIWRLSKNFYENEPVSLYLNKLTLIESIASSRQKIQLMSHPWLGKVLIINGEIQHIEKYQALYHEMLVHLPIAFIPNIESVLILGGGSLFAAREVLKYPSVKRVVLCDHDHCVLNLMEKYYPHAKTVITDKRFEYVEQDGSLYISQEKQKYDLIVNDCFNLALESGANNVSYFHLLSKLCTRNGVCVDIIYRHIFDRQVTIDTLHNLHYESKLALSLVTVPEYPGILHLETIWGNSNLISQHLTIPINAFQQDVISGKQESPFLYFSPNNLPFYLYLPPYIKEMFNL